MKITILLLPLFAAAGKGDFNFSTIDVENGLSNNQVYAIFRDSLGFVWFGTASGLNRFDGYSCKVFVNTPTDSSSIEDNYVSEIFAFPGNKLWIGCKSAASVYNPLTEKFDRNYQRYLKSLALPQSRILYSLKDRRGAYWFLFEKEGLYRYSPATHKTVSLDRGKSDLAGTSITSLSEDIDGNLWLATSAGILLNIDAELLVIRQKSFALKSLLKHLPLDFRVFADRQNKLWVYAIGEPMGVFKINPATDSLLHFTRSSTKYRLSNNLVRGIVQDENGAVWIGTDHGGLNLVQEADNSNIKYLVNNENNPGSISYNSIETVYRDKSGLVWVGTGKKGVSYINQNITQFELYRHEPDNAASLPYSDVNCFAEDKKGNYWVGTNGGGLLYFNRSTGQFTSYKNVASDPGSLCSNILVSLYLDHTDKLWIGTYLGGLDVFDGKKFRHYRNNPADPYSISNNSVWSIHEDKNHLIWIGTLQGGLDCFDPATEKFVVYSFGTTRNSNYIPVVKEDRDGNLWVGTYEGIRLFNKERTKITSLNSTANPFSLSHQNVIDLMEDSRGFIWVGTRNGLSVYNKRTQKFKRFHIEDGLPDNTILTIAEDKIGNLWLTTPKGICQLMMAITGDNISFSVRKFTETNNVQGKVFNEKASMVSSGGLIFKGGSNGFNVFDPQKIIASKALPQLVFTNIDIFNNEIAIGQPIDNKVILRNALPFADSITLNHNESIFSIEFTALDFSKNSQFAYILEGFNRNWMYSCSNKPKVTYTNLDPGTYYFKIKATNSDGVWGNNEKTLTIVIKPLFWKTSTAFVLYFIVLALLLYGARYYLLDRAKMRFEVINQRNESESIRAMDAVKTKFFTNVSHEFRTPLSLILSPLDRVIRNSKNPDEKKQIQIVQRNAKRLLNLVNQLLDFRKMDVQQFQLHPTEGDLVKFMADICESFSDISEMKNISLAFTADVESFVTCFDKDKMEKILFNLLSNAFKYTPSKGAIEVKVVTKGQADDKLSISVSDTGIGIPADKQSQVFERFFQADVPANITNAGTGIGLAIAKEFIKLHNGTITVQSEPDKGTKFTVLLPVQKISHALFSSETSRPGETVPASLQIQTGRDQPTDKPKRTRPVILLVEDNDDFRFYLKDNLVHAYEVVETCNGQEAWEKLDDIKPDLIVSDLMMPYMDGIELARRVRKKPSSAATPFILLTSGGDEELQLESYRLGVSDYMTKPFNYEILASRIKNLLLTARLATKKTQKLIEAYPCEIEIQPADEQFIASVVDAIEKNMSNPEYSVEELSKDLFMHRAGMYRKLLALTGTSPLEFIRDIRLKRGKQLLEKSQLTISEVAYEVGFYNPKKFSQHFKEKFGVTPSVYHKQHATTSSTIAAKKMIHARKSQSFRSGS